MPALDCAKDGEAEGVVQTFLVVRRLRRDDVLDPERREASADDEHADSERAP